MSLGISRSAFNTAKPNIHQSIIDIAMNGPECRGTALALNISVNMIRCYLKKLEPKQIAQHVESGTKVVISCEADEQWSFVRCKSNPYGLFYAYDRTRKRILARIFDALEMR